MNTVNDSIQYYLNASENKKIAYSKRLFYNKKAEQLLTRQFIDSLNLDKLIDVATNFNQLNAFEDVKHVSMIILERSNIKKDNYFKAQSFRWLGIYYENISANDSAFYYYSKAEKIFKKLKSYELLCWIYRDQALVRYFSNDFLGSDESLVKALRIAKKLNFAKHQANIYMALGSNASSLGDYDQANLMQNNALSVIKSHKLGDNLLTICYNHIGLNYFYKGEYKKSIRFYQRALNHISFINEQLDFYTKTLDNLNRSKVKLREYRGVEKAYLETSKIRDSVKINFGKNHNRLYMSEYYEAICQISKAKQFAYEAYELSQTYRNADDMLLCLKQLIKVDKKNALSYSQDYIRISDSMQLLERQNRNKFAKIAYETEELTNQKDQAVKRNWIISICAGSLILILVLLFIIKMQRARQKRLQLLQIQQKANEEIYNLLLDQQNKIDVGRQIEKKRIAQDLHDGILNRLASTRFNLHNLNEKATPEIIKKCLPFIAGIQEIEKEIRSIAHDLNQGALANTVSFVAVVNDFIEEQKKISNINVHLEIDSKINWEALSNFKKIHIFRIIQEAFQNINKHAEAKTVIASILKEEDNLLLEIFDDGKGFSPNKKKKGIGLQNIEARVKSCNGIVEFKSRVNQGTTISVNIPIS